jgi:uncharacterized membrane-anchored protein
MVSSDGPDHERRLLDRLIQLAAAIERLSAATSYRFGDRRSENVGSRFLSLLQSALLQTFSAVFWTAKKPNCRRHSRNRLGGSVAERYGKLLSERRFVSGA